MNDLCVCCLQCWLNKKCTCVIFPSCCAQCRSGLWLLGSGLLHIDVPEDWKEPHQCGVFWPGPVQQVSLSSVSRSAGQLLCICHAWLFVFVLFSNASFVPACPSEHSRHWFFRGRMVIDGQEQEETLFSLIMDTQRHSNQNNVIKFCDNSR